MALPKVMYVMGPPGAGKGTQAELLAQKLNYHRFSTGAAFREVSQQATELGREVKELIDNGFLAPPALAARIVIAAVEEYLQQGQGLIFDGTPRTKEEAAIVDDFFVQHNYGRPLVIALAVNREEMIRRNSKRRFCLGVKNDFTVASPEDEERCRQVGGTVGMRPDDDPAKQGVRWDEFQNRTWPVIEQYRRTGRILEINGEEPIEVVHENIMNGLKSFEEKS